MSCRTIYHALSLSVFLAGCPSPDPIDEDSGATGPGGVEAVCTEATPIPCEDDIVSDLSLHDDLVSDGAVTNEVSGADFITSIDASAGGFGNETQNPWVYVRFTEEGAERIDIDDETALESLEWHLAARRFILRLNGGDSGPSCVGAAPFLEKKYNELTEVATDVSYALDDYYTEDCTLINDSSGLEGSPQVALGPWWEYPGCVKTTGVPFQVQLEDGRVIKLVVTQYYGTDQNECDENSVPGGDSAQIQIKWTFLQ